MIEIPIIEKILHYTLVIVGIALIIAVITTYKPHKVFQSDKTITKPFLLIGITVALSGITELTESFFEGGSVLHGIFMISPAVLTIYGFYRYRKLLELLDVDKYAKTVIRIKEKEQNNFKNS